MLHYHERIRIEYITIDEQGVIMLSYLKIEMKCSLQNKIEDSEKQ